VVVVATVAEAFLDDACRVRNPLAGAPSRRLAMAAAAAAATAASSGSVGDVGLFLSTLSTAVGRQGVEARTMAVQRLRRNAR
jgi:hypothetical protein